MTLKTGVMPAENSDLHHRNKLHLKIYSNRKQLFKIAILFHNVTVFTVFLGKFSLGEHKRHCVCISKICIKFILN